MNLMLGVFIIKMAIYGANIGTTFIYAKKDNQFKLIVIGSYVKKINA